MGMPNKDIDPLYWQGQSINAMSREALQQALYTANAIIADQKDTIYNLRKSVLDAETSSGKRWHLLQTAKEQNEKQGI